LFVGTRRSTQKSSSLPKKGKIIIIIGKWKRQIKGEKERRR
jgi:hypothetical protein